METSLEAGTLLAADYAADAAVVQAIYRQDKYNQYLYLLRSFKTFPANIGVYDDRKANLGAFHAASLAFYSRVPILDFSWKTLVVSRNEIEVFTPSVQVFLPHNLSSSGANTTLVDRCEKARDLHGAVSIVAAMKPPSGVEQEFAHVGATVTVLPQGKDLVAEALLPTALMPLPAKMQASKLAEAICVARLICNSVMPYPLATLLLELQSKNLIAGDQIGMISHEYYEPNPTHPALSTTSNEKQIRSKAESPRFTRAFGELGDRCLMVARLQRDHYGQGTVVYNGFQKRMWDHLLADPSTQAAAKAHMRCLGLTEHSVLIMTTGIISERKGQDIIPRVAQSLMLSLGYHPDRWEDQGYDKVVFLMVGARDIGRKDEAQANHSIEQEITAYELGGKVVKWIAVPQEKLAEFYAMFSHVQRAIALQTSNCEVMPVSLVEMANAGALPVVTDTGATAELIPDSLKLSLLMPPFMACQQAAQLEKALWLSQLDFELQVSEVQAHALGHFDIAKCEEFHESKRSEASAAVEDKTSRLAAQRDAMSEDLPAQKFYFPEELTAKPMSAATPATVMAPTTASNPPAFRFPFIGEVSATKALMFGALGAALLLAMTGDRRS